LENILIIYIVYAVVTVDEFFYGTKNY